MPEPANNAAGVNELKIYQMKMTILKPKHDMMNELTIQIIDSMNPTVREKITAQDLSIGNLTARTIFTRLQVLFANMKPERKIELKTALKKKLNDTDSIESFFTTKVLIFKELANSNQAYDGRTQFEEVYEAICDEGGNFLRYPHSQGYFTQNFPTEELKTLGNLRNMLVREEEAKPQNKKAGEMFAGATTTKPKENELVSEMMKQINKLSDQVEKLAQNQGGGGGSSNGGGGSNNNGGGGWARQGRNNNGGGGWSRQGGGKHSGGGAGGATPGAGWTQRQRKPRTHFCSSHGWNKHHHSHECQQKRPGHRDAETEDERRIRLPGDTFNDK